MGIGVGLAAGAEALKNILAVVEGLAKIQKWLFVQPKEAAAELSRIIGEIMKATPAVTQTADKLLRIIDEAKPNLAALAQAGDGSLLLEIQTIRPHCHDIDRIANEHLWQWLAQPGVDGADAQQLRDFLTRVGVGDEDYFKNLEEFAKAVQDVAAQAFKLAAAGNTQEAMALLGKAAPDLFEARLNAVRFAQELTLLQNEFRRRALGLPPT